MAIKETAQDIKAQRPLSPHLQIYKPQITSTLSILHRLTGVAISAGSLLLVYWLTAAAYGPDAFARAQSLLGSWLGQAILIGMSFGLYYHLSNGIRHLFWDAGYGFEMRMLRATGIFTILATVFLTAVTWIAVYLVVGSM